jgi:hypothetical protein
MQRRGASALRERTGQVAIAALIRSRLRQGFKREHAMAWDAMCVRIVTPADIRGAIRSTSAA